MNQFLKYIIVYICLMANSSYADSLWMRSTTNERGIFADRKAYRVGDILKIIVNVNSATDSAGIKISRDEKRENSTFDNPAYRFLLQKAAKNFNLNVEQSDLHSTSGHKGGGELKLEYITALANFSVTVIDVLPNRNLVIEGSRRLVIMDQVIFTTLRGIVRMDDISRGNEVDAIKVADMHFDMLTEGSITDVQNKGLITKINDTTNLF